MARIRTLKPEFWQDEKLGPLRPIDRLIFLGLVSQADDAGRLIDSVKMLDGLLFPYTNDSCSESLEILWRLRRIRRYTSGSGQALIQIENWSSHQKVNHPSSFVLPEPEGTQGLAEVSREPLENGVSVSRIPLASISTSTNDQRPTTNTSKPAAPVADMWAVYLEELGGTGRQPTLTAQRSKILTSLWAEMLRPETDPIESFREILQAVQKSDYHMSQRAYHMPESLFRNAERRDRWFTESKNGALNGNGRHEPPPLTEKQHRLYMRIRGELEDGGMGLEEAAAEAMERARRES